MASGRNWGAVSGTVAVTSAGGHWALHGPGVYQTDTSGVLATQSGAVGAENAPIGTDAISTALDKANGNGNAGGNGNGNGNGNNK